MKNLNKLYVSQKENELKKLEDKALSLESQIQKEKESSEAHKGELDKLQYENNQLMSQYNMLKNMLIQMGILLDIENKSYNIKEWDNLYLKSKTNRYVVISKNEEEIYFFDKDTSCILQDIFTEGYSCSLVVIRVLSKNIKAQLRFISEEK